MIRNITDSHINAKVNPQIFYRMNLYPGIPLILPYVFNRTKHYPANVSPPFLIAGNITRLMLAPRLSIAQIITPQMLAQRLLIARNITPLMLAPRLLIARNITPLMLATRLLIARNSVPR